MDLGPRLAGAFDAVAWGLPDVVAADGSLVAIAVPFAERLDAVALAFVFGSRWPDIPARHISPAMTTFEPTRAAALAALDRFLPNAGRHYAEHRNFDRGVDCRDNVSVLSPYVRHRIISEQAVVAAVLDVHGFARSEKFIQEVFWRTYWKGWLQQRPAVWRDYLAEVEHLKLHAVDGVATACGGETGIECFDYWTKILRTTGYLHNHARMWFASIWIFTLRLPWQLGADFFLQHLADGDPASNTLSWRWVAGLQTLGKHYVASADNIERYTGGRFARPQLALHPEPLAGIGHPDPVAIMPIQPPTRGRYALLLTEEDMYPLDALPVGIEIAGIATVDPVQPCAPKVSEFKRTALQNAMHDLSAHFGVTPKSIENWNAQDLAHWAKECGVTDILTPEAPVGFVAPYLTRLSQDLMEHGVQLRQFRRRWDDLCWPHARKGFFAFKGQIPAIIRDLNLV
jgi:deoxyribodipyrimidine photo-lyase